MSEPGFLTDELGTIGWVHDLSVVMAIGAAAFGVALLGRIWGQPVSGALAGTPCVRAPARLHA